MHISSEHFLDVVLKEDEQAEDDVYLRMKSELETKVAQMEASAETKTFRRQTLGLKSEQNWHQRSRGLESEG